jgi:DNA-binding NarL/FixJ family response regulator
MKPPPRTKRLQSAARARAPQIECSDLCPAPLPSATPLDGSAESNGELHVTLVQRDPGVRALVAKVAAAQGWSLQVHREIACVLENFKPLSAGNGEAPSLALPPRVCLLPLRLRSGCGLEWTRTLAALDGQTRTVLLAEPPDAAMGFAAIYAGAWSFLVLPVVRTELIAAVQAAAQGLRFMTQTALRASLDALCCPEPVPSCTGLTSWQTKVLWAMGQGRGEKGAAWLLDMPVKTVHTHANRMYPRLGVHTLNEAIEKVFGRRGCAFACVRGRGNGAAQAAWR